MDAEFKPLVDAAYAGDFLAFKSLIALEPKLVTKASKDPEDSPNLIQFIVVEGGLGKIPNPVKFLNFLIENGSNTDKQIVAAASVNARELVDALLEAGVPLDDGAPWTAVEETLYWKHPEMAEYLINVRGAKLNTLCASAMMGDLDNMARFFNEDKKVVDSVAPIYYPFGEVKDSTQQDALDQAFILALRNGQYDAATFLLDRGADINSIAPGNHESCTALHRAAFSGDREMVDWLLDRGAVAGIIDPRFNADAIGWAKHEGHSELAEHIESRLAE